MRDMLKSKKYFEESLEYTDNCIEEFEAAMANVLEEQGENSPGIKNGYNILVMYYTKKLNLQYSLGETLENVKKTYIKLLSYYSQAWDTQSGYMELVRNLSLAVLLSVECFEIKELENKIIKEDLNDYLVRAIDSKWKMKGQDFVFKNTYESLRPIIEEKEGKRCVNALKNYLEKQWYGMHRETAWYNSHKSRQNTYYGYWSYEAGAIVRIMNLNDEELKQQKYYPYDLVHFKKEPDSDKRQ